MHDELPLDPADMRQGDAHRVLQRLVVPHEVVDVGGPDLIDPPRADPVLVDVGVQRRVEVAHHDGDLRRVGEQGLWHGRRPPPGEILAARVYCIADNICEEFADHGRIW